MARPVWRVGIGGLDPVQSAEDLRTLLCRQRGIDEASASFFQPEYETAIHDPYLLFGMQEAVDRIYFAIKKGQRILVYGDYDADGVTSSAILVSTVQELGASVFPYLPHRMDDGYGLNQHVLERLLPEIDLVISVDCGVANVNEIAWLKKKGKDTIVVDHHEMAAELPPARVVLHPRHPQGKYPWGYLCGAGMAWKLCQALLRDRRSGFAEDRDKEKWLLDLVLLGTVADVMPLLDENRAIARFGLMVLQLERRPGLKALLNALRISGKELGLEDVGYKIVPRLNAPGRLEHAQPALELLLATDRNSAERQVAILESYNTKRQSISRRIAKEAEAQVVADSPVVFAFEASWPAGVVGLVAGQLARKFNRPAVVVGSNGRHAVGSARSPKGHNILHILEAGREHLLALGGHAQAAGFSVKEELVNHFHRAIVQSPIHDKNQSFEEEVRADAVVGESLLHRDTAALIERFGPFGEGNAEPMLIVRSLPLLKATIVGKKQEHAKFIFGAQTRLDAIGFGLAPKAALLGNTVDVVGSLGIDRFFGSPRLQLKVKDIISAGKVTIKETVLA
ncbi:MAG: single-stranded-DNA-specific exonuclease RecJ [Candidatus Andersenbacteria bacterium]|nr:single-stranded-DNA-specific exonuclease RecJ [Candidatus Andersenbacteria bacterium]